MKAHRDLRTLLCELYPHEDQARKIAHDAGLDVGKIDFTGGAELIWFRVLEEAQKHGPVGLYRVRVEARRDYPDRMPEPAPPPPSQGDEVQEYLDWGWRHYRVVRLLGYFNRDRIQLSLDEVFVDLVARIGRLQPGVKPPTRFVPDEEQYVECKPTHLQGALQAMLELRKVGLVLLGDPGAGKTTLLKHLFCRVVAEGSASIGLAAGLCPVLLRFSQLQADDLKARGLSRVLRRELAREGHKGAGEKLANRAQPLVFLLDGLDEVRDETTRVAVCRWLDDEVHHWPGSHFVATCRFVAWQKDARLFDQFLPADIQWLDPPKVKAFVGRWYSAVVLGQGGAPEEAHEKAHELLTVLLDPEREAQYRLREMTRNPLLLSTICLVHRVGERLPERRGRLYAECIGFLLEVWAGPDGLSMDEARHVLQPLAWHMHEQQVTRLSSAQVSEAIAGPLGRLQKLTMSPEEFLRRAREICGLLSGVDAETYEFLHLSFQEYLAAAYARSAGRAPALAAHIGDPFWREAILLALAMDGVFVPFIECVAQHKAIADNRDLLRACLDEATQLDPSPFEAVVRPPSPGLWAGMGRWFTGRRPPLEEIKAVFELFRGRHAPEISQWAGYWADPKNSFGDSALVAIAQEVAIGPAEGAPEAGAGPANVHGVEWIRIPAGRFWMGSSKKPGQPNFDPEADDDETPAHEVNLTNTYWIARHPTTNESYAAFLRATGHREPGYWSNRRFNEPGQPVVGVDCNDARAFCAWLSQSDAVPAGWVVDLPTEAEWEYAARGTDGRKYPWGNEAPTADRAVFRQNWETGRPLPVGGRPSGQSPWGCEDMSGNVWEWTSVTLVTYPSERVDNPRHLGDGGSSRVIRGGSWAVDTRGLRCAVRYGRHPGYRSRSRGFRVVCRVAAEHV